MQRQEMAQDIEKYGLDLHCTMIMEDYRKYQPAYQKIKEIVLSCLENNIKEMGMYVNAFEARVKAEESLAGKLELKGSKYADIFEITDIVGARVITFYQEDVDKVSAMADKIFEVDWENSVDKRKMHELTSFGYNSLHYICRIPKTLYFDPEHPEINEIRWELQMRTALQHVWSVMHHDTGYKSGVDIPQEYLRNLSRLAGMLELADEQFSLLRRNVTDFKRKVQALVQSGDFDQVPLDVETFRSYIQLHPFDKLTRKIADINQAEVHETSEMNYLMVFQSLGFKTLGDIEKLIKEYSEYAYQLALFEVGNTDLDIISSTIAPQDLLIVYVLINDGTEKGLIDLLDKACGVSSYNQVRAKKILSHVKNLKFMANNL